MNHGKQHMDEELLVRFIVGEADEKESAMVHEWIDLSTENKLHIEKLRKIWSVTENPVKVEPAKVNVDLAWKNVKDRIDEYSALEAKYRSKQRSLSYYVPRVAAVLLVGLLIFTIYRYQLQQVDQIQLVAVDSTLTDKPLPDGTLISLNEGTSIEYPKEFATDERRVKLEGEAFFKVQADATKPFIVEAQEAIITVLGTSFNVKALNEDAAVEVLVEEGLVQLSNPNLSQTELLHIGEKGIYLKETDEVKKETDIDVEALYWLNKTLLFRDTKLSVVFETLERLYDVKIEVNNPDILNCLLTAKFSNESIDHIIEHISTIFDLENEKEDNNILIKGDGCL